MAQGDLTLFNEFTEDIGDGTFNLTQTFKIALITSAATATAGTATPALGDFTECTGGSGYTTGGESLTTTWSQAAGTATFDATGSPAVTWSQNGSGPTDIMQGIIYQVTTGNPALAFIDMTTDGSTPISLQAGDITWEPNASGIFTLAKV